MTWDSASRRTDTPIRCRKCLDSGIVDGIYTGWCDCETGRASKAWCEEDTKRNPYDYPAPDWIYARDRDA